MNSKLTYILVTAVITCLTSNICFAETPVASDKTLLSTEPESSSLNDGEFGLNFSHPAAFMSNYHGKIFVSGVNLGSEKTEMKAVTAKISIEQSPFGIGVQYFHEFSPLIRGGFKFSNRASPIRYSNGMDEGSIKWQEVDFAGAYLLNPQMTVGFELVQVNAEMEENGMNGISATYFTFIPSFRYLLDQYDLIVSYRPSKRSEGDDSSVNDFGYLKLEGIVVLAEDKRIGTSIARSFNAAVDSGEFEDSWDMSLSGRYLLQPDLWTGVRFLFEQAKYKYSSDLTAESMGSWDLVVDAEWSGLEKHLFGAGVVYTSGSDERVVYGVNGKENVEFTRSGYEIFLNYLYQIAK